MNYIKKIILFIENLIEKLSKFISWFILLITLTAFTVVVLRYFYNLGFVWMQEIYVWMHGIVFLFGASYALKNDKHVRVDIIYRILKEKKKASINLIFSVLFLLPFIFIISKYSIPYVLKSWQSLEQSREAGGLGFLYLYKTSLLFFCIFLFLQTVALILRCVMVLNNKADKIFFKLNK